AEIENDNLLVHGKFRRRMVCLHASSLTRKKWRRVRRSPFVPPHALQRRVIPLPEVNAFDMCASHSSHSLRLGVEARLAQEPFDVDGGFNVADVQPHEAVALVRVPAVKETFVVSEESRALEREQEGDDLLVFDSLAGNLATDLPEGKLPPL